MNTTDITNTFEKPMAQLPMYHQWAYIYCLATRVQPCYTVFSQTEKWGNTQAYNNALMLLKTLTIEQRKPTANEQVIIDQLVQATPNTDDFGSLLATAALDACVLLLETFDAIQQQNTDVIPTLVSLPFNAVQMYIEELNHVDTNYKNYDAFVFAHPLMESEMNFQHALYKQLHIQPTVTAHFFDTYTITPTKLANLLEKFELATA